MRTPNSWMDKGLLEDELFATAFLVHALDDAPARRRRGGDWHLELAQEIKSNAIHLAAAERWIEYAFAAEGASHHHSNGAADGLLLTFIRFYWAWYKDGKEAATKVVNDERKKRGFQYMLPKIIQPGSGVAQGSAADAASSSVARPSKPHRKRKRKAAANAQTSRNDAAAISTVPNIENIHRSEEDGEGGLHAVNPAVPQHDHDFPECSMDVEDKEVVVFAQEQDIDTYVEGILFEHDRSILPITHEATPATPPSSAPPTIEASASASPGSPLTSISSGPDSPASNPPIKATIPRRKKPRTEIPLQDRRQRLPREAANTERLSLMVKRELAFHKNLKRGREDEQGFESLSHAASQAPNSQKSRPATKVSKKLKPRVTSPTIVEDVDSTQSQVNISAVPPRVPPVTKASAATASAPTGDASKRRRKAKGTTTRKKVKAAVDDDLERPNKRRRNNDGGRNAIAVLNDAMTQQTRRGEALISSAGAAPDTGIQGRKRTRLQANPIARSRTEQRAPLPRKVVRMPQGKSGRKRLANIISKTPPVLGAPANLPEADGVVVNAATEALLNLRASTADVEEWDTYDGVQDEPQTSDDEEDIPLSVALAAASRVRARRHPAGWNGAGNSPQDAVTSATMSSSLAYSAMPNPSIPGPDDNPSLCWPDASGATSSRVLGPGTASSSVSRTPQHTPAAPIHKQPLMVQPGIWAESRQEVCESFDWFRSYQGGVYFNNDMVKGYLLSAFSSSRDMFARDGRLIISHGGGKAESIHSKKGQHEVHEADDQREEDKSVRALLRTYQMKRPLALIIDDRYALFPYDLAAKGYTYVVLGFYHIAHAWAEREPASNGRGFVVRYKFAFEWCEKQPEPWWLKHTSPMSTVPPGNEGCNPTYLCATCSKSSPRVYDELGMCLRPNCPSFWSCDDHTDPPERLTYNQFFLDSRTECVHEMLEDIAPLPPAVDAADGVITSRRFCKGWHCKRCGRLSCRYKWEHWECKSCGTILTIIGKDRHAKEFRRLDDNGHFYHHKLGANSGIIARPLDSQATSGGRVWYHVYILPENRGRIYLIMGNATINGAAHEIFAEYQAQARSGELRFRRWPLRSHQCRGTLLTNYFSQNTGEPYRYVGGTANTVPFQGAPSAVVKARDLIQERMATVMQADAGQYEFNEVLSAAYMEKQKMAFHSDAEPGLGPRVASLSLGAPAYMYFRVLKKYRQDKGGGLNQNVLSLYLRHGDVLIMDGAAIQEYYEHTVVPVNFRIAATARYISTSAE